MESHLNERVTVHCPLAQAGRRLSRFFHANGNHDGDTLQLNLRLGVTVPGASAPIEMHRRVVATIQPNDRPGDMTPRYAVQWAPEEPGPFPLFSGELLVEGADTYETFDLRLTGAYLPPLGAIGAGFDAVIGNRIAKATANDLLDQIRQMIESEFVADEQRKPGARPVPV